MTFLKWNLSAICHVWLITGKDEKNVVVTKGSRIFNPFVYALETLARSYIIADDRDSTVLDIGWDERLESLLTRGVPQIQNDDLILNVHLLWHEIDTNRGLVALVEGIVDEAMNDTCLTNGLVAEEDDFVLVFADSTRILSCQLCLHVEFKVTGNRI